ncbi:hypothetical protein CGH20_25065, partial [Vibrio parahaemolyticus]
GNLNNVFHIPEEKISLNRKRLPDFIEEELIKNSPLKFGYSQNAIPIIGEIIESIISEDSLEFLNSDDNS